MKYLEDSVSLVVVGKWNIHILSPDWIAHNVLNVEEVNLQFAVNAPELLMRIEHNNVLIQTFPDRLMVMPQKRNLETWRAAEEIVRKITDILQYTPVSAFGVNFNFIEDEPSADLISRIAVVDSDKFSDLEMDLAGTAIKRTFSFPDSRLNFSLTHNNETDFRFSFNFHYEVTQASKVAETVVGKFSEKQKIVETIMSQIYDYSSFNILEGQ
jgi:hypothetical protein